MSISARMIECPLCHEKAQAVEDLSELRRVYTCPNCGRFEHYPLVASFDGFNMNHLSSYFAYNHYSDDDPRYFSTCSKEICAKRKQEFENCPSDIGYPVQLTAQDVENWYPKRFSEKIDFILQWIESHTNYWGAPVYLEPAKAYACFFVEQFEYTKSHEWHKLDADPCNNQLNYIVDCLVKQGYIESETTYTNGKRPITLTPKGYERLDDLKVELNSQKNVLVAMQFGEKTTKIREAIKEGIRNAGYHPILIDEVEHNDFITPEILKHIKESKFVVVDLTFQNNGAYFEEGYAMGLGKPVIQLCTDGEELHFDIKQKNTILWKSENEIAERLKRRILATIE